MSGSSVTGVLLVDKPDGPTSREVLDGLERSLGIRPLGHAGTLDPLASGLLVALAGAARKLQDHFLASTKTYEARIRLGKVSESLDREGPVRPTGRPVPVLDRGAIESVLARFIGAIDQVPPAHSAVHVAGRRAHERARRGEEFELKPRRVRVDSLDVLESGADTLALRIVCGAGTYVRSLARDLGETLGCGAYLEALRRTASGAFRVEDARPPDALRLEDLLPLSRALASSARLDVDVRKAARLAQGAWLPGALPRAEGSVFAWLDGEPLCRLLAVDGTRHRSDLLLRRPPLPAR